MATVNDAAHTPPEDPAHVFSVRLLSQTECTDLLARAKMFAWQRAAVYTKSGELERDSSARQCEIAFLDTRLDAPDPVVRSVGSRLEPLLRQGGQRLLQISSALQVIRYHPGGHFILHRDRTPASRSTLWRRLSVVCYLNDAYSGGATEFPAIAKSFRLGAGRAIVFPSWYLHAGGRVESGEKYILNFFLGDPVVPEPWDETPISDAPASKLPTAV